MQKLRRALASDEKTFEPGHRSIATRQSNLALVLQDLGQLEEARDLLRKARATFFKKEARFLVDLEKTENEAAA
jgi:hypothetical protein